MKIQIGPVSLSIIVLTSVLLGCALALVSQYFFFVPSQEAALGVAVDVDPESEMPDISDFTQIAPQYADVWLAQTPLGETLLRVVHADESYLCLDSFVFTESNSMVEFMDHTAQDNWLAALLSDQKIKFGNTFGESVARQGFLPVTPEYFASLDKTLVGTDVINSGHIVKCDAWIDAGADQVFFNN